MSASDRNGVRLSLGMRVERDGRHGKVVGVVDEAAVFVLWDGEADDETVATDDLIVVDSVRECRRRRS